MKLLNKILDYLDDSKVKKGEMKPAERSYYKRLNYEIKMDKPNNEKAKIIYSQYEDYFLDGCCNVPNEFRKIQIKYNNWLEERK